MFSDKTGQRLKMCRETFNLTILWGSPFRTRVRSMACYRNMCKNRRMNRGDVQSPSGHHRFRAFLESVQATTEATQGPRNHVWGSNDCEPAGIDSRED
ncbi:unnamed protein product [Lasius platythorax]|uniref:Uncharacterized protein n=1 Tax=Lasius platythorax TaxID=488582 RepID=A0AAV2P3D9_9HYME